jgi:hypothetical protein
MFIKNIITILPLLPANIGFVKRFSNSELHIFLFLYADFSLFYILYHKKGLPVMDNPVEFQLKAGMIILSGTRSCRNGDRYL